MQDKQIRILNVITAISIIELIAAGRARHPWIPFTTTDQVAAVPVRMLSKIRFWDHSQSSVFEDAVQRVVRQRGQPFTRLALVGRKGGWRVRGGHPQRVDGVRNQA
jgi:hypothetical protein